MNNSSKTGQYVSFLSEQTVKQSAPLNIIDHPLEKGVTLIEASAGTGKTYTIAMLVLRFLVEKKLDIEKILIVTFSRAATAELRERVRKRLIEAREVLAFLQAEMVTSVKDENAGNNTDITLIEWAKNISTNDRPEALSRLQLAIANIDQAAIFTIHSFCQRMLGECALESASSFDAELIEHVDDIVLQIADDFWRRNLYGESKLIANFIREQAPSPEWLLKTVDKVLDSTGKIKPVLSVSEEKALLLSAVRDLIAWWQQYGEAICKQYEADEKNNLFNKCIQGNWRVTAKDLDAMKEGDALPKEIHCFNLPKIIDNFRNALKGETTLLRRNGIKKIGGIDVFVAHHEFSPPPIENVLDGLTNVYLAYRYQLAEELRLELPRRMEALGVLRFESLIRNLAIALEKDKRMLLQKRISTRFDVALIDEFQDTDNDQYRIFFTLFVGSKSNERTHPLYLIGDPKQAIYSFRGADIHSYFQAKQDADRCLTLDTNYRSHNALVNEINYLFSTRYRPFLYERNKLSFYPVNALHEKDSGCLIEFGGGQNKNGFEYWLLPRVDNKTGRWSSYKDAIKYTLPYVVTEIKRLLSGNWGIENVNKKSRSLAPQDIAILVRTNAVAIQFADELSNNGIPAVVASSASVFRSKECGELILLLQAIVLPGDIDMCRGAMTISWFGREGNELYTIYNDEGLFGQWRQRFALYLRLWQEGSFFTMMTFLLQEERVIESLAVRKRGERAISNIRQLLTLIQKEAKDRRFSPLEVLRWLQKCRSQRENEEAELLLESDSASVRIITIHKAKGLEYNIVFCPDLWLERNFIDGERNQIKTSRTEKDCEVVDLGSKDFAMRKELTSQENSAEAMRLLYVAITRAKFRCYLTWVDYSGFTGILNSFASALGCLLFDGKIVEHHIQVEVIKNIVEENGSEFRILDMEKKIPFDFNVLGAGQQLIQPPPVKIPSSSWQVSSFSALARLTDYDLESNAVEQYTVEQNSIDKADKKNNLKTISITGLPSGPNFGNVVHDLLERLPFQAISHNPNFITLCQELCLRYRVELKEEKLRQLLINIVTTPLVADNQEIFSLTNLNETKCLKEMEFYIQLGDCSAEDVGSFLAAHDRTVQPLRKRELQGYLTGFIDLVCEYNGRYYLFDYKSNFLGDLRSDYQEEALEKAMEMHNYGLQYWIYTLALHRWLKCRVNNYSYSEHFGGVFYLFVRGMMGAGVAGNDDEYKSKSGIFYTRPDEKILEILNLRLS